MRLLAVETVQTPGETSVGESRRRPPNSALFSVQRIDLSFGALGFEFANNVLNRSKTPAQELNIGLSDEFDGRLKELPCFEGGLTMGMLDYADEGESDTRRE